MPRIFLRMNINELIQHTYLNWDSTENILLIVNELIHRNNKPAKKLLQRVRHRLNELTNQLNEGYQRDANGDIIWNLDLILDLLCQYHQRATYGAVGNVLNIPAILVMHGRPRNPLHSWVVNQATFEPGGYNHEQRDPNLYERDNVLTTGVDLLVWLNNPH